MSMNQTTIGICAHCNGTRTVSARYLGSYGRVLRCEPCGQTTHHLPTNKRMLDMLAWLRRFDIGVEFNAEQVEGNWVESVRFMDTDECVIRLKAWRTADVMADCLAWGWESFVYTFAESRWPNGEVHDKWIGRCRPWRGTYAIHQPKRARYV